MTQFVFCFQVSKAACILTTQHLMRTLRSKEAAASVNIKTWPTIIDTGTVTKERPFDSRHFDLPLKEKHGVTINVDKNQDTEATKWNSTFNCNFIPELRFSLWHENVVKSLIVLTDTKCEYECVKLSDIAAVLGTLMLQPVVNAFNKTDFPLFHHQCKISPKFSFNTNKKWLPFPWVKFQTIKQPLYL